MYVYCKNRNEHYYYYYYYVAVVVVVVVVVVSIQLFLKVLFNPALQQIVFQRYLLQSICQSKIAKTTSVDQP